jgi:hypothetical protein
MGTESLLNEYLAKTRAAQQRAESSDVVKRIEAIFDELGLPWRHDDDCWAINSDVGEVMAGLDDDEDVLSIWQVQFPVTKPAKKNGELFDEMLRANADTTGACFAIRQPEDGPPYVFVVARISAKSVDAPEIALTLSSVFSLASLAS